MSIDAHREKSQAAISSVFWSLVLTGIKIWAGVATGSLGILSEALHSGLDFLAAAMTFYAVRVAACPADEGHPYGHEKVESLSALAESLLLVITCSWIFWEAIDRLFFTHVEVDLNIWAFGVVIFSLVVDVNRSAMLRRVARKHKSQALEADALHFTTDIWSSGVVLVGLICVWLARFVEPGSWVYTTLHKADAFAALGVAIIVLKVSWGLSKKAIHTLMDGGSKELSDSVREALQKNFPDYPIVRLRLRDCGARAHAELDIAVPSDLAVEAAHGITQEIEDLMQSVLPNGEVIVHVEPKDLPENTPRDLRVHHIALYHAVRVHGYAEAQTEDGLLVFMDVELPPEWDLARAQVVLSSFESDVKHQLGAKRVVSRLEPNKRMPHDFGNPPIHTQTEMKKMAVLVCKAQAGMRLTDVDIRTVDGVPILIVRGEVAHFLTVMEVHVLASRVEKELKHALPDVGRIMAVLSPSPEV